MLKGTECARSAKNAEKVRVGAGIRAHLPLCQFVLEQKLHSLIGLTTPGRPGLVFCSTCSTVPDVCCEVT